MTSATNVDNRGTGHAIVQMNADKFVVVVMVAMAAAVVVDTSDVLGPTPRLAGTG